MPGTGYVVVHGSALVDPKTGSIDVVYGGLTPERAMEFVKAWATQRGMSATPVNLREGVRPRPYYPVCSQDNRFTKHEALFNETGFQPAPELLEGTSSRLLESLLTKSPMPLKGARETRFKFSRLPVDEKVALTNDNVGHIDVARQVYKKDPEYFNNLLRDLPWGKVAHMLLTDPDRTNKVLEAAGGGDDPVTDIVFYKSARTSKWMVLLSFESGEENRIPLEDIEAKFAIKSNEIPGKGKKERTTMGTTATSNGSFLDSFKEKAANAAWQVWAEQSTRRISDLIADVIAKKTGEATLTKEMIASILKTPLGSALVGMALSTAIQHIPVGEGEKKERAIRELQEAAIRMGLNELADLMLDPVFEAAKEMLFKMPDVPGITASSSIKEEVKQKVTEGALVDA